MTYWMSIFVAAVVVVVLTLSVSAAHATDTPSDVSAYVDSVPCNVTGTDLVAGGLVGGLVVGAAVGAAVVAVPAVLGYAAVSSFGLGFSVAIGFVFGFDVGVVSTAYYHCNVGQ